MQFTHLAFIALDLARERVAEAELQYRYRDALRRSAGPGLGRRMLARTAAGVSRASASVARRLDAAAIDTDTVGGRSPAA